MSYVHGVDMLTRLALLAATSGAPEEVSLPPTTTQVVHEEVSRVSSTSIVPDHTATTPVAPTTTIVTYEDGSWVALDEAGVQIETGCNAGALCDDSPYVYSATLNEDGSILYRWSDGTESTVPAGSYVPDEGALCDHEDWCS